MLSVPLEKWHMVHLSSTVFVAVVVFWCMTFDFRQCTGRSCLLKASDNSGPVAAVNPRQLRWHIDSLVGATGRGQTPHSPLSGLSLIHKLRPRGGEKRKRVLLPASREAWPRRPFSKTAARLSAAITLATLLPHRQSSTLMMRRLTCDLQVPASYLRGGLSRVKTVRTSNVYWDF